MKLQTIKLAVLIALLAPGCFSCTNYSDESEGYRYEWDDSNQQKEFRPANPGTKTSSFAIDGNIVSFAVPYLVGTTATEHLPQPGWGSPEGFSPHFWTLLLVMAKGIDVKQLVPTITLAPGATIKQIEHFIGGQYVSEQVENTEIIKFVSLDFSHQVGLEILAPDGSTVSYSFLAVAIGDVLPCFNCNHSEDL